MKRFILSLLLVLAISTQVFSGAAIIGSLPAESIGAPSYQDYHDDFERASGDSLGPNWTEIAGDLDIDSDHYIVPGTTGSSVAIYAYDLATKSVYGKMKVADFNTASDPQVVFYYNDTYWVGFGWKANGSVLIYSQNGFCSEQSLSSTATDGDWFGVKITLDGSQVIGQFWDWNGTDPDSGGTPDPDANWGTCTVGYCPSGSCGCTSNAVWDITNDLDNGGADCSFAYGYGVGIRMNRTAAATKVDDWFVGDYR